MVLEQEVERLRADNVELRQLLAASQEQVRQLTAQLTAQLATALAEVGELQAQLERPPDPPPFVKPKRQQASGEPPPRQKRAQEHNTSRKRAQPTRIERHALAQCPECAYHLTGESLDYRREVIELPPPQPVEVIEHQVVKRWCPHCACWRSPQLVLRGQVLGQGRIGVRVAALVVYLRTTLRLPVRQVQSYLATLHGLQLSVGEIVELAHAVREQLQGHADALLAQVRQQPVVHQDETGWRENGQNGYLWATVSDGPAAVRYYEYSPSRSHRVAQRLLSDRFRGVLVSDFYAAYNLIPGRHQRCWTHLLRDLHALKDEHAARADVLRWAQQVRQVYDDAQLWLNEHPAATPDQRRQQYAELYQRICQLGRQYCFEGQHPCWALAKRLLRHQEELFQFVLVPGVPASNNLAERSIRPLVIMRKISGGSRSEEGSKTRLTLASLLGTWAARQLNPLTACLAALQQPATIASG
jgi:transposase